MWFAQCTVSGGSKIWKASNSTNLDMLFVWSSNIEKPSTVEFLRHLYTVVSTAIIALSFISHLQNYFLQFHSTTTCVKVTGVMHMNQIPLELGSLFVSILVNIVS